jgi:hypothetical protein
LALAYAAIVLMGGRWPKATLKTTWRELPLLLATALLLLAGPAAAVVAAALLPAAVAAR